MKRKITSEDILPQFKPVAEKHLNECVSDWLQFHERNVTAFRDRFQKTLTHLEKLPRKNNLLQSLWSELNAFYGALREWTSDLAYVSEQLSHDDIRQGWQQQFNTFLEPFPKNVKIRLEESYWEPQPSDSLHVRLWKYSRRRRNQVTRARFAVRNLFRKILRREALTIPKTYQNFSLLPFATCYLEIPFDQFLLNEWEKYLSLAVRQVDALHNILESMHDSLILLEEAEEVWIQDDAAKIAAKIKALREYLPKMEVLFEEMASHRSTVPERFEEWFAETERIFYDRWQFAGTHVLRENRIVSLSNTAREKIEHQFNQHKKVWQQNFSVEQEDWENEIALRCVQLTIGEEYLKAMQEIQEKLSHQVIPTFLTAIDAIGTSTEKFKNLQQERGANLKRVIITENRALQKSLRDKILPEMMDSLLEARFDQVLNRLLEAVRQLGNALPEKQTLFRKKDLEHIPPKSEVDEVPIGELFNEKLLLNLERQITEYQKEQRQTIENIIRDISEIDQVVEFNLDAALNLLVERKETGEAFQTVIDGLERAQSVVEQFIERGNQSQKQSQSELLAVIHKFISDVQELLDNEALLKLKIQLAQTKAKERIRAYRQKTWRFFKLMIPHIWSFLIKTFGFVRGKYFQLRKITGLAPTAGDARAILFQYLSETQQKISSLPYVYQRLFENRPLTDERFFSGRDEELSLLSEDFKIWQQGYFITSVVIGERGSGKTTVINFAKERILKNYPLREINIQETIYQPEQFLPYLQEAFPECKAATLPEMEEAILQLEEPLICIVENIQNLFLRTVDGFDLLERFLLLISRTHRKVYWLLTCTLYSWEYLNKVIKVSRYFRRVLPLDNLTREEMENVILRRHRVTGYQLFFETPEKIQKNRRFKKLTGEEEQQTYLRDVFFTELQEVASGNVFVAMLYWIRAIQKIENNRLTLSPVIELDYSFIYQLSPEELFTIGALMQHEMLKPEEHAQVFHQSEQQSVLLFNSLINKGIVIESENGCRIHPFLYRPAIIALKRLNIIH